MQAIDFIIRNLLFHIRSVIMIVFMLVVVMFCCCLAMIFLFCSTCCIAPVSLIVLRRKYIGYELFA